MALKIMGLSKGSRARLSTDTLYLALLRILTASPPVQLTILFQLRGVLATKEDSDSPVYGRTELLARYRPAIEGVIKMVEESFGLAPGASLPTEPEQEAPPAEGSPEVEAQEDEGEDPEGGGTPPTMH
jgi:hypothetical protein